MSTPGPTQVLRILADMRDGDPQATEKLLPSVYEELRKLAHQKLEKEAPGLTLQTTALVHEAYLRLVGDEELRWNSRGHFFGAAAEAMRRILVERARRHQRQKHGGGWQRVALGEIGIPSSDATDEEILALDEALRKLESEAPGRAEVIKLRYFAGLSNDQAAEVLGVSPGTIKNRSAYAQAWLRREIRRQGGSG